MEKIRPMLFTTLKKYSGAQLMSDVVAGIIVAIIALMIWLGRTPFISCSRRMPAAMGQTAKRPLPEGAGGHEYWSG